MPVAFTTCPPAAELRNALLFCRVKSWLTGCRLVSLPFSDHCEPLVDNSDEFVEMLHVVSKLAGEEGYRWIELRPLETTLREVAEQAGFAVSDSFVAHRVDLHPDIDAIFRSLHRNCMQRQIRRAERENLTYEEGNSEQILLQFFKLFVLTRRRHHAPPQSIEWFRNLIVATKPNITIRIAAKEHQPVAGILTLRTGTSMVYKYGASDTRFHNLGAIPFLFWRTIQDAKSRGLCSLDLGRSDLEALGLITFKERLGSAAHTLRYLRFPNSAIRSSTKRVVQTMQRVSEQMPEKAFCYVGKLIYPHLG